MKRVFFATAFAAALAGGAAAQTGTATPPQSGAQKSEAQQVTFTGCLQRSASGVAGTTGAAASSAEAQFILANATPAGAAGAAATGTSGMPAGSSPGTRYRLVGGNREELEKHLNSKVEIRGTLDKSAYGSGTATAASGQTPDDKLPALRVTSVKQIAATCAGGD